VAFAREGADVLISYLSEEDDAQETARVVKESGRSCIAVSGDMDEPVLLSLWMVETSAGNGERRVVVQPIAVKQDGTRIPAVERQCEKYLQAPAGTPAFQPEQRSDLFVHAVEPTLQRELKHKGAVNGDGSYSAELIGYVEIASSGV